MPKVEKILVAEDSKLLRQTAERALARAGYVVSTAVDGEEVLRAARENPPDLILLDMLLPKMSGQDALRALKKDAATANIPVVVLTVLSRKNAEKLQSEGAFAFLEKSELALDKGPDLLVSMLRAIIEQIPQDVAEVSG